jgi:hypothetical protein
MTTPRPRTNELGWLSALGLAGLLVLSSPEARAQSSKSGRQVTVFGIVATPGSKSIDPKLQSIATQLRKVLPNHGFKLLDVQTKRLVAGRAVSCNLGGGFTASTALVEALDEDGKVELQFQILRNNLPYAGTLVATPPNQLFFGDVSLESGSRLLIGIGAR